MTEARVVFLSQEDVVAAGGLDVDDQRIFSTPVGLAFEDVAAAARVYRRAVELGIGTELSLWESPIWV